MVTKVNTDKWPGKADTHFLSLKEKLEKVREIFSVLNEQTGFSAYTDDTNQYNNKDTADMNLGQTRRFICVAYIWGRIYPSKQSFADGAYGLDGFFCCCPDNISLC